MKLYLVQHAKSKSKDFDPDRSITESGGEDVNKIGTHLADHSAIKIKSIFHSGKLRAKQTADILTMYLKPVDKTQEIDGLEPKADPAIWQKRLEESEEDVMLVGHLPHLSRLVSALLCGNPEKEPVYFQNSCVVCLLRDEEKGWSLEWMLVPELF